MHLVERICAASHHLKKSVNKGVEWTENFLVPATFHLPIPIP